MQLTIWGLKSCDTCRKAIRALREAGHEVTLRDVREMPLTEAEIDWLTGAFGEAALNRKSTTWRGLEADARAEPADTLLSRHPALMKRPVTVADGTLHLGWNDEVRAALGL